MYTSSTLREIVVVWTGQNEGRLNDNNQTSIYRAFPIPGLVARDHRLKSVGIGACSTREMDSSTAIVLIPAAAHAVSAAPYTLLAKGERYKEPAARAA